MTGYERIVVGETFDCGIHTFTAEEIKRFATAYDPQRFHIDEVAAAETHFGALCASGWHTAAAMMRQFVGRLYAEIEAARARGEPAPNLGPSLGIDELKWLKPVYVGDEITFSGRIVAKRESGSRPGWGIVSVESTGVNQSGETVFSCVGHILVAKTEDV
jgi:acyl dehydratase